MLALDDGELDVLLHDPTAITSVGRCICDTSLLVHQQQRGTQMTCGCHVLNHTLGLNLVRDNAEAHLVLRHTVCGGFRYHSAETATNGANLPPVAPMAAALWRQLLYAAASVASAAANELLSEGKCEKVMAPKFEDGSLGALVATDGLSALREAGKGDDVGPVLAIYYAQKWRNSEVQPDMKLTPAELAAWVEQQAYDAWLKLEPDGKDADNAFPYMEPGAPAPPPLPAGARATHVTLFAAVCRRQKAQPLAQFRGAVGRQKEDLARCQRCVYPPLLPPPPPPAPFHAQRCCCAQAKRPSWPPRGPMLHRGGSARSSRQTAAANASH
eukprot:COSAG03_NODE_2525_length_2670_cov_13.351225_2_plen_327_part_00